MFKASNALGLVCNAVIKMQINSTCGNAYSSVIMAEPLRELSQLIYYYYYTTTFYDSLSGTTQVSWYQKDKPFWTLLKQT